MRKVALALSVALIVVGLVIVGAVAAQGPVGAPQAGQGFVDENGDGVCDLCGGTGPVRGRSGMLRGGMMGGGMMGARWNGTTLVDVVAQELDLTVEQVVAELQAGKTLKQVITDHQGDPAAVVEAFIATRKAALDQLVKDGRLTQAQADQMLAHMQAEVTEHLDEARLNCGMGQPGTGAQRRGGMLGRGGMMGRGNRAPLGNAQSS